VVHRRLRGFFTQALHRHSIGIKLLNGITAIKLRDGLAKVLREEQVLRSFKCVFS
jgi:hypothetical protein